MGIMVKNLKLTFKMGKMVKKGNLVNRWANWLMKLNKNLPVWPVFDHSPL